MEQYGSFAVCVVVASNINEHHIRRPRLFTCRGTRLECKKQVDEFFKRNPHVAKMQQLEFLWTPDREFISPDSFERFFKE